MSGGGFFGKWSPLNPAPDTEVIAAPGGPIIDVSDAWVAGFDATLTPLREVVAQRLAALPVAAQPPVDGFRDWLAAVARLKLSERVLLALGAAVRALDGARSRGDAEGAAHSAFWVGVLAQRLHLAPREQWRRLTPRQRQAEGPRLAQPKRCTPPGAEVDAGRRTARKLWGGDPAASTSRVARCIAEETGAPWETVRRRIRDLKPDREVAS